MTLKNNRAPLLCCFQLCAWFHCHMWIQTGVRVWKRLSWVLTSVALTFDLWPCPFAWISLLTMVITPENSIMIPWWEHGEKGVTNRQTDRRMDRQTDGRTDWTSHIAAWSQLKTIGHLFYATSSFVHHFLAIGEFKLELQSRNAQSRSNLTISRVVWPWNLTDNLEKQKSTSSKQHQAICIISSSYVNSNWSYSPEMVKLGCDLCVLDLWPLTLTFCMDLILANGNNSWKFHDDTMMGT